jgi:hypothetical protein
VPARARPLSPAATAAAIAALGFVVGLAGDACHVASGTTRYEWDGVPTIWRSAIWFPFLVAAAVVLAAWAGRGTRAVKERGRADVVVGAGAVLAFYALTAVAARLWGAVGGDVALPTERGSLAVETPRRAD